MINNTLFRPSVIRDNRKKFNPEGFDLAAVIRAKKAAEEVENKATSGGKLSVARAAEAATPGGTHRSAFADLQPTELIANASPEEVDVVIRAAYKQVFGNAYLMESERLVKVESQLASSEITVMEFIRQLAQSDRYRTLFFEGCSNLQAIELNFKHLLGRAPEGAAEISEHIQILAEGGFEAEIDSYLDSDEYFQNFGTTIVPYYRGYQTQSGKKIAGFTHSFQLLRGASSSDKSNMSNTQLQLQTALLEDKPTEVKPLSTLPSSNLTLSPLRPTKDIVVTKKVVTETDYIPQYKSREFFTTPIKPNEWLRQYKAREAAATFPMARKSQPVSWVADASVEEKEVVIQAAYKQVFGNAYLMESERLSKVESDLKNGRLTVRGFIRELAVSELYRSRFFESCSNIRTAELNFKHLLGRSPDAFQEVSEHIAILLERGFTAAIESLLTSSEYLQNFGENTVPYYVGYATQTGKNVAGYNRIIELNKDICNSDRSVAEFDQRSQLQTSLLAKPTFKTPRVFNPQGFDLAKELIKSVYRRPEFSEYQVPSATDIHINAFADSQPVELFVGDSAENLDLVIRTAYKQVFGNAYLMESERLPEAESRLRSGEINVIEFVRRLAQSDRYRSLFFEKHSNVRSIELNFKHLLGRAPESYAEISEHIQILAEGGFEAEIDSYLDSDEYFQVFGAMIVPYYRGYQSQSGKNVTGFTHSFKLSRGCL